MAYSYIESFSWLRLPPPYLSFEAKALNRDLQHEFKINMLENPKVLLAVIMQLKLVYITGLVERKIYRKPEFLPRGFNQNLTQANPEINAKG